MDEHAQGPGWAPMGARQLAEYAAAHPDALDGAAVGGRFTEAWREVTARASVKGLVAAAVRHMRLLHAVDLFPRGGLCQGVYLKEALRRYEAVWLPLLSARRLAGQSTDLVPPLDVAFVWHLHRLEPSAYAADCQRLPDAQGHVLHVSLKTAFAFTDGSDAPGAASAAAWRAAHPDEPFWPPAPGARTAAFASRLSADVAAAAVRVPIFTHQLLRAQYGSLPFLNRALARYAKLLLLRRHRVDLARPVPPLDVVLMMHTHMSASGDYAADCRALFGRLLEERPPRRASGELGDGGGGGTGSGGGGTGGGGAADAGVSVATRDRSEPGPWRYHLLETQRVWKEEFRGEAFLVPGGGYLLMESPHPAEAAASGTGALAAFEEGAAPGSGVWRAGAHALYLTWLRDPVLQQPLADAKAAAEARAAAEREREAAAAAAAAAAPPPRKPGGLFACFGCGGGGVDEPASLQQQQHNNNHHPQPHHKAPGPPLTAAALRAALAGAPAFRGLPFTKSHPYWRMLAPAGADELLAPEPAEGAQLEVFVGDAAGAAAAAEAAAELGADVAIDDGAEPLLWSQR